MKNFFGKGPRVQDISIFNPKDMDNNSGSVILNWEGSLGFGQILISFNSNGNIFIDTEYMGSEFVREVFDHIISKASYDTDIEPYIVTIKSSEKNQEISDLIKKAGLFEKDYIIKDNNKRYLMISSLEDLGLKVLSFKSEDGNRVLEISK